MFQEVKEEICKSSHSPCQYKIPIKSQQPTGVENFVTVLIVSVKAMAAQLHHNITSQYLLGRNIVRLASMLSEVFECACESPFVGRSCNVLSDTLAYTSAAVMLMESPGEM